MVLAIETADGVLHRIDNIVMGWDIAENKTYLRVVKGNLASLPTAMPPKRNSSTWEIVIARIRVNAGTTTITPGMITDMRLDETVCGLVRDGVESIPTATLQAQAEELISRLEQAIVDAADPQIIEGGITTNKLADGAVTVDKLANEVFLKIYPIGSIYTSVVNTNPSTLFGGVWTAFATGRTLVGIDPSQTEFNAVEKAGGAKTHTLTVNEIPSHTHQIYNRNYHVAAKTDASQDIAGNYKSSMIASGATGGGLDHNNLQPYLTVYMWKRSE